MCSDQTSVVVVVVVVVPELEMNKSSLAGTLVMYSHQ